MRISKLVIFPNRRKIGSSDFHQLRTLKNPSRKHMLGVERINSLEMLKGEGYHSEKYVP